ncbi:MAG TPA: WD40 repeat domain-containing protein, partial [Thermoanaerobaculia bacterium]|nr:WD40 repeat domain-containing protein [Thermoanaerobaculia bacterium]
MISVKSHGGRVYVSDGRRTEVFSGSGSSLTSLGALDTIGASAMHGISATVFVLGGSDTTVRAMDLTTPSAPTTLFEQRLVPAGGTVNRIEAVAGDSERVYVAAGDLGLLSWDVSGFHDPFPLRVHPFGATGSLSLTSSRLVAAPSAGGLRRYELSGSGLLTADGQWESRVLRIRDGSETHLLASAGDDLFVWDVGAVTPALTGTSSLQSNVESAILFGQTAMVILEDRTAWSVDFSISPPTAAELEIEGSPSRLERGGAAAATIELTSSGKTLIRYHREGNLSGSPVPIEIDGLAAETVSIDDQGRGAASTFRGLILLDFDSRSSFVVPQTDTILARDLAHSGSSVILLTSDSVLVHDAETGAAKGAFHLPFAGTMVVSGGGRAAVAGEGGIALIEPGAVERQPQPIPVPARNRYYRSIEASAGRVHLIDGSMVDSWAVHGARVAGAPQRWSLPAGTIDTASTGSRLCALASDGNVSCWQNERMIAQARLDEGADAFFHSIAATGSAIFVSYSAGCLSGGCRIETRVLSPDLIP